MYEQQKVKELKAPKMSDTDKKLSGSIMHAIEIDSAFKLYSFRIISPEQYISRIAELIGLFNTSSKIIKKEQSNGMAQ